MLEALFKKKLKNFKVPESGSMCYIPLNSKFIKFEYLCEEPNPLGERYQGNVGSRVWINTDAPYEGALEVSDPLKPKLAIIKRKGDVLDRYEIHPKSYGILMKYFEGKKDGYDNGSWHTSFNEIRDNEKTNFTVARFKGGEEVKQEGQLPFLKPNDSVLLQLADFGSMDFSKVKPWTSKQETEINGALNKLYLSTDSVDKIKDWLLFDLFKKGQVKPKSETCGIILYGPAGTGKTVTVNESLRHIFKDILDFKFVDIPIGNIVGGERSGIVGGFAKTLADIYKDAFKYISNNRKPYVIFIDEGDDLIEDVSGNDDNNSKWLHQGQVIMKNYMNPKRYPGIIFIISTNLPEPENFYEPFRDQRLGVVHFPIPNYERYKSLFGDLDYKDSLQNKLFKDFSRNLDTSEIDILAKICAGKITLRITANFCEKYNKNIISSGSFVFNDFKDSLIDYALNETDIQKNKELSKARTQQKVDELNLYYATLIKELDLLKRGVSPEEDRLERAKGESVSGSGDLLSIYSTIKRNLTNLLSAYEADSDKSIINDDLNFLTPLKQVLANLEYFNNGYKYEIRISKNNKDYLDGLIPALTQIIGRIVNKSDIQGDFSNFSQIIKQLPDQDLLFDNQGSGPSIISPSGRF